jgi:hypothetical protein
VAGPKKKWLAVTRKKGRFAESAMSDPVRAAVEAAFDTANVGSGAGYGGDDLIELASRAYTKQSDAMRAAVCRIRADLLDVYEARKNELLASIRRDLAVNVDGMGEAYVTLILAAVGGLDDQKLAKYLGLGGAKLGKLDVMCPRVETRGGDALPRFHDTVELRCLLSAESWAEYTENATIVFVPPSVIEPGKLFSWLLDHGVESLYMDGFDGFVDGKRGSWTTAEKWEFSFKANRHFISESSYMMPVESSVYHPRGRALEGDRELVDVLAHRPVVSQFGFLLGVNEREVCRSFWRDNKGRFGYDPVMDPQLEAARVLAARGSSAGFIEAQWAAPWEAPAPARKGAKLQKQRATSDD